MIRTNIRALSADEIADTASWEIHLDPDIRIASITYSHLFQL